SGEPSVVADLGQVNETTDVAVAEGVLAYQQLHEQPVQIASYDRLGSRESTFGDPGLYRNPDLSPDGSRLALEEGRVPSVWVMDLARQGVKTRFSLDHGRVPVWSPDGQYIFFARDEGQRVAGPDRKWVRRFASGGGAEEVFAAITGDINSVSSD